MKRFLLILLTALLFVSVFHARTEQRPETYFHTSYRYHNLAGDDSLLFEIKELLMKGGLSAANAEEFVREVKQYNALVGEDLLRSSWTEADISQSVYDARAIRERILQKQPDYTGYSSRITAYLLAGDQVLMQYVQPQQDALLAEDYRALDKDPAALQNGRSMEGFSMLFQPMDAADMEGTVIHLPTIQESFRKRGITFANNDTLRLVSLFAHSREQGKSRLYVRHAGVLLKVNEGKYYFLEKLSGELPYQVVELRSKRALSDYLMGKYDSQWQQDYAALLVLENDQLIEGYQENPYKRKVTASYGG